MSALRRLSSRVIFMVAGTSQATMHAGFQFIKMPLDAKARLLHEIGRQESIHGLHHPGVLLHVTIAEPQLDDLTLRVHPKALYQFRH